MSNTRKSDTVAIVVSTILYFVLFFLGGMMFLQFLPGFLHRSPQESTILWCVAIFGWSILPMLTGLFFLYVAFQVNKEDRSAEGNWRE